MSTTRQVRRQMEREAAKVQRTKALAQADIAGRRDRLRRQSGREKNGFYEGTRSVAASISPSRSRLDKRRVQKGKLAGRILSNETKDGREVQFHATKGHRSFRVAA